MGVRKYLETYQLHYGKWSSTLFIAYRPKTLGFSDLLTLIEGLDGKTTLVKNFNF